MASTDHSGSVARVARFEMMLVYAIQGQSRKVRRSCSSTDDEAHRVTSGVEEHHEAIHRVNHEADVVWGRRAQRTNGHALRGVWERHGKDIGPKTTVLLLGDARNKPRLAAWGVSGRSSAKARTCTA